MLLLVVFVWLVYKTIKLTCGHFSTHTVKWPVFNSLMRDVFMSVSER